MQFTVRKTRQTPTVIIISLIDILIVLLMFLTATTTFRNQPAIKILLPESNQAREGSSQADLVVTISKEAPNLYLGRQLVTLERLRSELESASRVNPELVLAIRGDTDSRLGLFLKVWEIARDLEVRRVDIFTKTDAGPER